MMWCFSVKAQYTITPVPPPPNFAFNDLWHFTIVRSQSDAYKEFYVGLRIFDGSHVLKVKSNSSVFGLEPGSRYYHTGNWAELLPLATSYPDVSVLQQIVASGGNFPPGVYRIVYTLYGKTPDGAFTPLGEDALETTVEALWPPMLLSPADGDSIDNPTPLLTWTPAFSSSYIGTLEYTLNLVEVMDGQNPYQAMQANPAYFSQSNIPATLLPYPPGGQILQIGKTYAWQVHARASGTGLGASEVWVFTLKTPAIPPAHRLPNQYFKPAPKMPADFVQLKEAYLPIAFDERYQPAEIKEFTFRILDGNKKPVGTQKDFGAAIKSGFNRYLIPVCASEGKLSLRKGKYFLEILTEKNTKFCLAFEITETHCHD